MAKPMTEPAFFVLTTLLDGPRHGYAILQSVLELSGGRVRPRVGTLYGVLDRLAAQGLIEPEREEVVDGRARRYYRLSGRGRDALSTETARLVSNAEVAGRALGSAGGVA
jgi:DNA-binding PadR family transcriptional regulator